VGFIVISFVLGLINTTNIYLHAALNVRRQSRN
jgi:hypothetical protein